MPESPSLSESAGLRNTERLKSLFQATIIGPEIEWAEEYLAALKRSAFSGNHDILASEIQRIGRYIKALRFLNRRLRCKTGKHSIGKEPSSAATKSDAK